MLHTLGYDNDYKTSPAWTLQDQTSPKLAHKEKVLPLFVARATSLKRDPGLSQRSRAVMLHPTRPVNSLICILHCVVISGVVGEVSVSSTHRELIKPALHETHLEDVPYHHRV